MWLAEIEHFRQLIMNRLAQPPNAIEMEVLDEEVRSVEYIIQTTLNTWRIMGFIDDTAFRTCRPGSGPVGNLDGPGRPRREFAQMIQRAFYRYVYTLFTVSDL